MLLVHISDIHFHHPICNGQMDPDKPFRTRLVGDVAERTLDRGEKVDAIVVTGDIAYAGAGEEFDAANTWLANLAERSGCPLNRIFVVPGNHDVDRNVSKTNLTVRNAQDAILSSKFPEKMLGDQFRYIETGRSLLAPLSKYNEFAAKFGCQLFPPDRLFWSQDLSMDDGVTLRLYGLTSTILSGRKGENDKKGALYLSPLQTVLDPEDGVVSVVLCHHPPDWFMDQDYIEDAVQGRALLQLFGHKHRNRHQLNDGFARFNAGAVNPDRSEAGWEPGYNLIRLTLTRDDNRRFLDVEAMLLVWQTSPDLFRPKQTADGQSVFRKRLSIRGALPAHTSTRRAAAEGPSDSGAKSTPASSKTPVGAEISKTENMRDLVFRFWKLTTSQRRDIARNLDLITDADMQLPEPERYGRALIRAKELEKIDKLAEEIRAREGR
jgi:predicted phosphodiesterase